jgi:phage terminase large subunit
VKKPKKPTEEQLLEERLQAHIFKGRDLGLAIDQQERFLKAGVLLQDKQMLFAAACRECDKPDGPTAVGYGGGRGSSKSHGVFAQMAVDDCQRVPGLKCLYLRKIGKTNREQFDDIRRKVLSKVKHNYAEQKGLLTIEGTGSQIRIGHFKDEKDIDAYLGVEYDLMVIEEATQLSFSKWKNILSCLRTSKTNWRPRVYCPTNPGGIGHGWYKQVFVIPYRNKCERETRYIQTTVHDNKYVNKEYLAYLESLVGWQRESWLNGSWDIAAGQFFTTFRASGKDCHVVDSYDVTKAVKWVCGFDYGWSHWSVFTSGYIDDSDRMFIVDASAGRHKTPQENAQGYFSMLARHRLHPYIVDRVSAGPDVFSRESDGTTIADQYRGLGINLECGKIDRINGWSEIIRRFGDPDNGIKPTLFIHRRCDKLIDQIPLMMHNPNKPEDLEKVDVDEEGNGGDDWVDSLRMLVASNPHTGTLKWLTPVSIGGYQLIGA